jgi:hypothetical protein
LYSSSIDARIVGLVGLTFFSTAFFADPPAGASRFSPLRALFVPARIDAVAAEVDATDGRSPPPVC